MYMCLLVTQYHLLYLMYACAVGTVCMHVPLGVLLSQIKYDFSLVRHANSCKPRITSASAFLLTFSVITILQSRHHNADLIIIDYFNLIERFLCCTVPPSFNSFSSDQVVVEGDPATITLSCSADGNPTPKVSWTRVLDNASDSDVPFTGNSYVINKNRNNAGTYRCEADNGIGSAINQTIRVTIYCEYQNNSYC